MLQQALGIEEPFQETQHSPLVEVVLLVGTAQQFCYKVPEEMQSNVTLGSLVEVPLINRKVLGVVIQLGSQQNIPMRKVKSIVRLLYP